MARVVPAFPAATARAAKTLVKTTRGTL